jgi:iron complex outermembrane recepter protein
VIVLRGVRWTDASGTPSIPLYVNETPFDVKTILQTMYDIGQIEVLRGPQGTSRGAPSISGAVTITTRKPDLNEVGGYVSGQYGQHNRVNVQGAVSVPLIADKLAVRIAGAYDKGEGNRIHSLFNSAKPHARNWSLRGSVRFEPADNVKINVMYQHLDLDARQFQQVAGTGSPGQTIAPAFQVGAFPNLVLSPNYNGPAITAEQYLSVQSGTPSQRLSDDKVSVNASADLAGHTFAYILGWERLHPIQITTNNVGHELIGPAVPQMQQIVDAPGQYYITHEFRISSIRGDNLIDYDLGYYRHVSGSNQLLTVDLNVFGPIPGGLGFPLIAPINPNVNPAAIANYALPVRTDVDIKEKSYSFYGNVTVHLGDKTEFNGGLRYINDSRPIHVVSRTGLGRAGVPGFFLPVPCNLAGGVPSPIYGPTVCDTPIAPAIALNQSYNETFTPVIYNATLSHRFSDAVLAYATVGSSYRTGLLNIGTNLANLDLTNAKPEKATSYEIGVKTTLPGGLHINGAVFQIDYKDSLIGLPNIPYLDVVTNPAAPSVEATSRAYFLNIDARVRGVEFEIGYRPNRNFSLNANLSYAKIQAKGGSLPCNDPAVALTPTNVINFCPVPSGKTLSASAPFQANVSGNYQLPLGSFDGYFRFLINHQGGNPNFGFDREAKAHTLVDLFAGLTGGDGAWDLGVYAKNVFNEKTELTRSAILPEYGFNSGYSTLTATPQREFGVTLRYAFGSR